MTFRSLFDRIGETDLAVSLKPEQSDADIQRIADLSRAVTALSVFAAGCDDTITLDEYMEIDMAVSSLNKKYHFSDELRSEIQDMTGNHNMTWKEVTAYLDKLSVKELEDMKKILMSVFEASDGVSGAEKAVYDKFTGYIESRS